METKGFLGEIYMFIYFDLLYKQVKRKKMFLISYKNSYKSYNVGYIFFYNFNRIRNPDRRKRKFPAKVVSAIHGKFNLKLYLYIH